jgi:hypothetical protein
MSIYEAQNAPKSLLSRTDNDVVNRNKDELDEKPDEAHDDKA